MKLRLLARMSLTKFWADNILRESIMMKTSSLRVLALIASIFVTCQISANSAIDRDHDGVADNVDQCLNTPQQKKYSTSFRYAALFSEKELSSTPVSVAVDSKGCALDSDNDKVADYMDFCPNNSALQISAGVNSNGCPRQSDGDGTPDYRDRCPGTARGAKSDRYGCPE